MEKGSSISTGLAVNVPGISRSVFVRTLSLACLMLCVTSCKPPPKNSLVSGTIETDEVRAASRYGGRVEKVIPEEGQSLKKGDDCRTGGWGVKSPARPGRRSTRRMGSRPKEKRNSKNRSKAGVPSRPNWNKPGRTPSEQKSCFGKIQFPPAEHNARSAKRAHSRKTPPRAKAVTTC